MTTTPENDWLHDDDAVLAACQRVSSYHHYARHGSPQAADEKDDGMYFRHVCPKCKHVAYHVVPRNWCVACKSRKVYVVFDQAKRTRALAARSGCTVAADMVGHQRTEERHG